MTADVQRELADKAFDALDGEFTGPRAEVLSDRIAAALLPTVRRLIADAEKRAAAAAAARVRKFKDPQVARGDSFGKGWNAAIRVTSAALDEDPT